MVKNRCLLLSDQRATIQEKIGDPKIGACISLAPIFVDMFELSFFGFAEQSACFLTDAVLHVCPPDLLPPRI